MVNVHIIEEYLAKKYYKNILKYEMFHLLLFVSLQILGFVTKCNWHLQLLLTPITLANIYFFVQDVKPRKCHVDRHLAFKLKAIYVAETILMLLLPESTYIVTLLCAIPLMSYYMYSYQETLGKDSLHVPYLIHFVYGYIGVGVVFFLREALFLNHVINIVTEPFCFFTRCLTLSYSSLWALNGLVEMREINAQKTVLATIMKCTDSLTKCLNKGAFKGLIPSEGKAALFMDLDFFKIVNDDYGHAAGDYMLAEFARRVSRLMQETKCMDTYFIRYGGEEFVCVGPMEELTLLASRILNGSNKLTYRIHNNEGKEFDLYQTISIGIYHSDETLPINRLLKKADEENYRSKENGRNRIYINGELAAEGDIKLC